MPKSKATSSADPAKHEPARSAKLDIRKKQPESIDKPPKPDIIIDEKQDSKASGRKPMTKKKKLLIAAGLMTIITIGIVVAWYVLSSKKPTIVNRIKPKVKKEAVKPKTLPSPLTGVEVAPELAQRPVVAVMIENLYPDARPQSGLSSAGVVYETLAEGGITRYQAFFGDTYPSDLGPVRSLRAHYLRWGLEYDAPVVHAGGSADALDLITPLGMKNLDQFYNGAYFRRITKRYAPHNLYTTGVLLEQLVAARGFNTTPTFTPWPRKDDAKSATPTAATITVDPSYVDYRSSYTYDPATNSYARFIRGVADIDAATNTQIKPKNVIVLKASVTYAPNRVGKQTTYIQTVGSGTGYVFMDGAVQAITWRKTSDKARTELLDVSGAPIKLNRGQSWVCVIPTEKSVTYQ